MSAQDLADPQIRGRWRRDRGLLVFSLHDPGNPLREVDLFAEEPLPFEQLWASSHVVEVAGIPVRVAGIEQLIEMKRAVGRPQDLADVAALEALQRGPLLMAPAGREGGWDAAARAQRRAWAATTPTERLQWLDEALAFAALTGALARDRARRAAEARAMAADLGLDEPGS